MEPFTESELKEAIGPRPELMTRQQVLAVFKSLGSRLDQFETDVAVALDLSPEQFVSLRRIINESRQGVVDAIRDGFSHS